MSGVGIFCHIQAGYTYILDNTWMYIYIQVAHAYPALRVNTNYLPRYLHRTGYSVKFA